jgi:hypothetical protein
MRGRVGANAKLEDLRSTNAAIVAVEKGAQDVPEMLRKIEGVTNVEVVEGQDDDAFQRWRVTSSATDDVCPTLFDALRTTKWKVGELRPEPKSLERVFRDLSTRAEVQ